MEIREAVLWALLGGGAAEMTLFLGAVRPQSGGKELAWPWKTPSEMRLYCVAIVVRLCVGGALAAPFADTQVISDASTAFLVGVTAPLMMAKFATIAQSLVYRFFGGLPLQDSGTVTERSASQDGAGHVPEARAPESGSAGGIIDGTGVSSADQ
ncbi:hypothetical protein ABZX90_17020 [Streptomyces sp. NPDC002935]|uniref:hypothetical protein n=1 Tax=unclassified Streptomyces TaxID=2593676 RepID=UPI003323E031